MLVSLVGLSLVSLTKHRFSLHLPSTHSCQQYHNPLSRHSYQWRFAPFGQRPAGGLIITTSPFSQPLPGGLVDELIDAGWLSRAKLSASVTCTHFIRSQGYPSCAAAG